ncbi:hypothetical protein GGX14DRAFT_562322 [Mycena pura]|uniref:Uncharacterized protein n=1 Tax=Mycena pura TaxID=153505 RepID=A0AAD6YID2_9AGAR|nr:hypothetical protein GGX14DRAFT_562322 [Mycena pura]
MLITVPAKTRTFETFAFRFASSPHSSSTMTRSTRALSARKKAAAALASQPSVSASSEADLLSPDVDFNNPATPPDGDLYTPEDDAIIDSDPITPPPSRPTKGASRPSNDSDSEIELPPQKKSKKAQMTADTSSDSEPEGQPKRKPKKTAGKPKTIAPSERKLVLLIPRAELEGDQRQVLTHATTFDDALHVIYETIGCSNVGVKPKLVYKLSNATAKAGCIGLSSDADWDGLLDDVVAAGAKKDIKVHISVTEQYLASLRAKLGIKAIGPKQKGKSKIQILDLEHKGSGDDDDFDDGLGIMEKEKKSLEQLEAKLGNCQLCGPGKMPEPGRMHWYGFRISFVYCFSDEIGGAGVGVIGGVIGFPWKGFGIAPGMAQGIIP